MDVISRVQTHPSEKCWGAYISPAKSCKLLGQSEGAKPVNGIFSRDASENFTSRVGRAEFIPLSQFQLRQLQPAVLPPWPLEMQNEEMDQVIGFILIFIYSRFYIIKDANYRVEKDRLRKTSLSLKPLSRKHPITSYSLIKPLPYSSITLS